MTRRLTIAFIGVVLATLLIAGAGTLVLANVRARQTTERQLRAQATELAANVRTLVGADTDNVTLVQTRRRLRVLRSFSKALHIDDIAVLTMDRRGDLVGDTVPAGIDVSTFDMDVLAQDGVLSGNAGNTVYAAASTHLPLVGETVVIITRTANAALGRSVRLFLLASVVTLLAAAAVAVWLGRRLTKPVREASHATQRIAAGDLDTRLPNPPPTKHDEMAELTRSINSMASSLARVRVLEQQFLLSVSHDLRTPLTSIRGYAEAISDGAAEPQQAAAVIRSEAERLERLVADLLDLAKVQTSGFSLAIAPMDLATRSAADTAGFVPAAQARGITVRCEGAAPVMVMADPDRISQIIANLIENALRYARESVVVKVSEAGGHGIVTVDDDGAGIAAADLAHVFERLYVARDQPTRRENASGLGLAIVKELAEAMHGKVLAGSNESGGARFSVYLPLA
ncbi:MAG: two-component system, OmpR family, sensor kinase [Ilumatobacteraceae bacterium]|nr:two-component system, OmpR family, sensor kinase [Ilumatobacteraceae bacterium]